METLAQLSIGQMITIGIVAVILILLLSKLSKKGIFSFHGKGFNIGQDLERRIIRQQLEYVDATVEEALAEVRRDDCDIWQMKYTAERVKDVLQNTVTLNHINSEKSYIQTKQLAVWSEILKTGIKHEYYSSDDFKQLVFNWTKETIGDLLEIRKYLENN